MIELQKKLLLPKALLVLLLLLLVVVVLLLAVHALNGEPYDSQQLPCQTWFLLYLGWAPAVAGSYMIALQHPAA